MRTLVVSDLHLVEEEMPFTKGAVQNSIIMLDEVVRTVKEDKEIGLVVFLGDISNEHETPKTETTKNAWESRFRELRRILDSRVNAMPEFTLFNRDGTKSKGTNRVLTIKGNHDFMNNDKWRREKTYCDDLIERGILAYPDALMYTDNGKEYYFQFRSFGEGDKTLDADYINAEKVVVFAHDWFYGEELPEDYQYWASFGRTVYELSSVVSGVDVFIQGHAHSRYEPFTVSGLADKVRQSPQKPKTDFYIPGTNARSPFAPTMFRDEGYNLLLDTKDGLVVSDVFLKLKPYKEYFNMDYKKK